jgi:hypothetical protein
MQTAFTIDFQDRDDLKGWSVINDGVMGGRSKGEAFFSTEGVVFEGEVSLENNGGFASFRGPYASYDLSAYDSVRITYRSEGIRLAFQLDHHRRFYLPNHKMVLPNTNGWETIQFSLRDMQEYRMGRKTGGQMDSEVLSGILRMGFITYDKRAGNFTIELREVRFY